LTLHEMHQMIIKSHSIKMRC